MKKIKQVNIINTYTEFIPSIMTMFLINIAYFKMIIKYDIVAKYLLKFRNLNY